MLEKNCHHHQKVPKVFAAVIMEQLTTTNATLLRENYCSKTKETSVYQLLRASLRIF